VKDAQEFELDLPWDRREHAFEIMRQVRWTSIDASRLNHRLRVGPTDSRELEVVTAERSSYFTTTAIQLSGGSAGPRVEF
jgi:hypothetical protein